VRNGIEVAGLILTKNSKKALSLPIFDFPQEGIKPSATFFYFCLKYQVAKWEA
jgi:hypothetical protein